MPTTMDGTAHTIHLSREQILRVTAKSLREFGYDATTIRKIAGMLGCAVGSIYRYFMDKRELLLAVTQQTLDPVSAMVDAGGPIEQSIRMYHQLTSHEPETYRLMFWLCGPSQVVTGDNGQSSVKSSTNLPPVVQHILDGWAGQIGDAAAARQMWATLHGFILMGIDAEETLAALHLPARVAKAPAPTLANPATPRIVVPVTEPTQAMAERVHATPASQTVSLAAQTTALSSASTGDAPPDDVCLL